MAAEMRDGMTSWQLFFVINFTFFSAISFFIPRFLLLRIGRAIGMKFLIFRSIVPMIRFDSFEWKKK